MRQRRESVTWLRARCETLFVERDTEPTRLARPCQEDAMHLLDRIIVMHNVAGMNARPLTTLLTLNLLNLVRSRGAPG